MIYKKHKIPLCRVIVLIPILIFIIGIFCVNYISSLLLFFGIFLGVCSYRKALLLEIAKIVIIFLFILSLGSIAYRIFAPIHFKMFSNPPNEIAFSVPFFDEYKLEIKPIDSSLLKYEIDEYLIHNKFDLKITSRKKRIVNSRNIGFLLREVYIKPFNIDAKKYIDVVLDNGDEWRVLLCKSSCPKATVDLLDFPQSSLYSIKNEKDVSVDEYLGNYRFKWSARELHEGIRFAYLKPPFYIFTGLTKPFFKLAKSNQFLIVVLGVFFGIVLKPIIKSTNIDIQKQKSNYPKKILVLAAIPRGLHLDKEIRSIEQCIRGAVRRDIYKVEIRVAVQDQDIRNAISEEQPIIVHFCGHGLEDGSLVLEDNLGNEKSILPSALASLFELHTDYVECVVLNTCYSFKAAELICQHINYAIGMNQPIQDKSAIKFTQGFYDGLGYKISEEKYIYQRAFKEGLVAIRMDNSSQAEIPVFTTKIKGVSQF